MGMEQGEYINGDGGADFTYGYGAGGDEYAVDYAAVYAPIDYAPYEQSWEIEPFVPIADIISTSESGAIPYAPYEQSWEIEPFVPFADIIETSEPGYAPYQQSWPIEEPQYFPLPFVPYEQLWPIEEPQYFPLPVPPLPPSPATQQPNLPPACPGGQYHPYPIGHPQQNICIPFPVSQTPSPTQQPKSGQPPSPIQQAPKPPAQQQQQKCPTGQYRDPATGQCKPIPQGQPQACPTGYYRASNGQCLPIPKCTTPGTVFDQARGLCVPVGQAISPLPEGVEGLFDELKKLPWWIWLALGGLILLSRDGEGGRKTTVTYRRAT